MIEFNVEWHGHAIAGAVRAHFNPACDVVIARTEGMRLLGGVIYQGYTGVSIRAHVAGFYQHWINRDLLWVCFYYPFNQLKCNVMFGEVPSNNKKALAFDRKLGFKDYARIEGVFPDADLIVLRMTREECRWLRITPRSIASSDGQQG